MNQELPWQAFDIKTGTLGISPLRVCSQNLLLAQLEREQQIFRANEIKDLLVLSEKRVRIGFLYGRF